MNDRNSAVPPAQQGGPAWAAARWLGAAHELALPAEVVDAARTCLIDWFACTLGGLHDPLVAMLQRRLAVALRNLRTLISRLGGKFCGTPPRLTRACTASVPSLMRRAT